MDNYITDNHVDISTTEKRVAIIRKLVPVRCTWRTLGQHCHEVQVLGLVPTPPTRSQAAADAFHRYRELKGAIYTMEDCAEAIEEIAHAVLARPRVTWSWWPWTK